MCLARGMTAPHEWIYVVTDVEVDGPWCGPTSMRSPR